MATLQLTVDSELLTIDFGRIMNTEAIAAQKVTGLPYQEWLAAIDDGDMTAITALVWIAKKRTNPELRFSDVEFAISDWRDREWVGMDEPADGEVDPQTPGDEAGTTEND